MRRDVDLKDISDGKLYGPNDMVKADCHGCKNCHICCTGMGNSVVLDPYDMYRMTTGLGETFNRMLSEKKIGLHVVDGLVLPSLSMTQGKEEACVYLGKDGRCSIHAQRPGICRLFPLGRVYEGEDFKYFLQTGECNDTTRTKIKVSKWIDTPMYESNRKFLLEWHAFLKHVEEVEKEKNDDDLTKQFNMTVLSVFYAEPYLAEDFYSQFEERLKRFDDVFESED